MGALLVTVLLGAHGRFHSAHILRNPLHVSTVTSTSTLNIAVQQMPQHPDCACMFVCVHLRPLCVSLLALGCHWLPTILCPWPTAFGLCLNPSATPSMAEPGASQRDFPTCKVTYVSLHSCKIHLVVLGRGTESKALCNFHVKGARTSPTALHVCPIFLQLKS